MNPSSPSDYHTLLARSFLSDAYLFALLKLVPQIAARLGLSNFDGMPFEQAFQGVAEVKLKRDLENLEDRDAPLAGAVLAILDAHRKDGRGLF
jgi:hypothetical protein